MRTKEIYGAELEALGFEKLNPAEVKENLAVYLVKTPLDLKTKQIKLVSPSDLEVYIGDYLAGRIQQIIFAGKEMKPCIASILERNDIQNYTVYIQAAKWLDESETVKLARRLKGKTPYPKISDLKANRENYPLLS